MNNSKIATLKMKDFVHIFRSEVNDLNKHQVLVYDLERKNGVIFLLPDLLQCGTFGLCVIGNNIKECMRIFEEKT